MQLAQLLCRSHHAVGMWTGRNRTHDPKGLRDRNSPTCTLSQNGYGDPSCQVCDGPLSGAPSARAGHTAPRLHWVLPGSVLETLFVNVPASFSNRAHVRLWVRRGLRPRTVYKDWRAERCGIAKWLLHPDIVPKSVEAARKRGQSVILPRGHCMASVV